MSISLDVSRVTIAFKNTETKEVLCFNCAVKTVSKDSNNYLFGIVALDYEYPKCDCCQEFIP